MVLISYYVRNRFLEVEAGTLKTTCMMDGYVKGRFSSSGHRCIHNIARGCLQPFAFDYPRYGKSTIGYYVAFD